MEAITNTFQRCKAQGKVGLRLPGVSPLSLDNRTSPAPDLGCQFGTVHRITHVK